MNGAITISAAWPHVPSVRDIKVLHREIQQCAGRKRPQINCIPNLIELIVKNFSAVQIQYIVIAHRDAMIKSGNDISAAGINKLRISIRNWRAAVRVWHQLSQGGQARKAGAYRNCD